MKLSAVIVSYNEEANVKRLMKSLQGVDEVVVADDGSTDNTVPLFESLGARVYRRHDHSSLVTDEDVDGFVEMLGWIPKFKAGERMFDGGANRNEAVSYAKHDWIFNPDCDEIVNWKLPELKKLMAESDIITCKIVTDNSKYDVRKLYNRKKATFVGRIHEVPVGEKGARVKAAGDLMYINHYQLPRELRLKYLAVMEYAVYKDQDVRTKFYLAREYFRYFEFAKAIKLFHEYLKTATWIPEVADAYLYIALAYMQLGQMEEARLGCMYSIMTNPDNKRALNLMSQIGKNRRKAKVWARYAEHAKNEDVLFVHD